MNQYDLNDLVIGIKNGNIIPYLGPGVLADVINTENNMRMPSNEQSLIMAMNHGQAMAPRLMYEFSRAAMHLELKKGRKFISQFLTKLYQQSNWSIAAVHQWLASIKPAYVIDINRDNQLQTSYNKQRHYLIVGLARLAGSDYRYHLYYYDGEKYTEIEQTKVPEQEQEQLPILFKPLGTSIPKPSYIASDADYVDYLTELMGGFAIPKFVKLYRQHKQYLFLGLRLLHDTDRMLAAEITYASNKAKGWALIAEPSVKEKKFCQRHGIEIIQSDINSFLKATQPSQADNLQ